MGDWYEIKELAGKFYIEFQSDKTEWQPKAVGLTDEQSLEVEAFLDEQAEAKHQYLKALAEKLAPSPEGFGGQPLI